MIDFSIFLGTEQATDPLGSVIININSTGTPNYQWVNSNEINSYGPPDITKQLNTVIPFKDTVAQKIKFIHQIPEKTNQLITVGDLACYTGNVLSCSKKGPYNIRNQKYYIDFMFMYFVNTGTENIYSPVFSVDNSRCDSNYGIILGVPKVPPGTKAEANAMETFPLLVSNPEYTNDLSTVNDDIIYKFTALNDAGTANREGNLQIDSIVNMVDVLINDLNNDRGQQPVIAVNNTNNPFTLTPGGANFTTVPTSFYPFILLRYVSENAPSKRVNINFSFAPIVG